MTKNKKHEFKTSLVELGELLLVEVHHHKDGHPVPPDKEPQLMVWKLPGNAKDCSFLPIGEHDSGFEWIPPRPNDKIFGTPQICPSCGDLTITNTHREDDDSEGKFKYKLRIKAPLGIYETLHTLDRGEPTPVDDGADETPDDPGNQKNRVTTNPRIKNT